MLESLRVAQLLFFFFLAASGCLAQTWPLSLFTSDPRSVLAAAAQYQAPQEVSALILDCSISAQIDEAGRLQKTTRFVSKVNRVQGIESVQSLSLPWSLARENRPVVKGRVITSDGQPHLLDDTGIVEQDPPNTNFIGAVKILAIRLPEVNVDSVVELQIEESDREPAQPGARFGDVSLEFTLPTIHFKAVVTSLSPADLHVEAHNFRGARIANEPAAKGHAVSVEASKFIPSSPGSFLPPEFAPYATVDFSNVASWQSVAQWYSGVLAKALGASTSAHVPFSGDEVSAVEKIYEGLRKEVKDNGRDLLSDTVAPRSSAEILKSGTADSRDEAVLLIAKLSDAGIPAKLALISAAPHSDVVATLAGFEAFNHALVYVPGPTPLWIDPAAEYTSVARLPVADQDRWALVIDPATSQLVRTPASTEKDNRQSAETELRLGDGNATRVSITIQASGSFEDALRPVINQIAAADENQKLEIAGQIFQTDGAQKAESTQFSDPQQLLEKSWLKISGEGYPASLISDEGGYVEIPGLARLNFQKLSQLLQLNSDASNRAFSATRTVDYYVPPPFTIENRYHVIPPPGYRLREPAPVPPVNIGPLTITTTTRSDKDGSLWLSYTLLQPKARLTAQELETMRNDVRKIANSKVIRIQLENIGTAKMKSGDLIDGLQILRRDADSAKDTVNPSLRLASAYVLVGARAAGVKLCEDLLKRNSGENASPTNVTAIRTRLGWIYQHDEFGRMLAPGMNAPEAEKNLRAATELVPADPVPWLQLADLYTYNRAGVRFGRSVRLTDAIQIYSKLDLNAVFRAGKLNDYALLLLQARKYPDIHELFLYPQADALDQGIKWAAFAASRSASDLKQELAFQFPSDKARRTLLVHTGRLLVSVREYQAAARLFRLMGKDSGIPQSELDRLDHVRVFDESAVSKTPPIAVFQRYVQAVLDPVNPDDWKKFVTPTEQHSTLQLQRTALDRDFQALTGGAVNPDASPYLSDLIDTTLAFTAEGSDAAGFHIKAGSTVGYVVKQGNEYVVTALTNSDAPANADLLSAQSLLAENKPQDAAPMLLRLHQQNPSDQALTILLADTLIQADRVSDAKPLIDALEQSAAGNLAPLRLREHLLAEQGDYAGAIALAKQICANRNAAAADWNDLAWTILFTQQNVADAKAASEKAAQLTNFNSPAVLHTLAIAQASALDLKNALVTGYKFAAFSGDPGEMYTIFGIITEKLGLKEIAAENYSRVTPEKGAQLSNYAFAQLRLTSLQTRAGPAGVQPKSGAF